MSNFKKHILTKGCTIRQALERLDLLAEDGIIFITDLDNYLVGSLTDGDVRRGLLKGKTLDNLVDEIIQPKPKFIKKGECDITKIIEYRENLYRILPVIDSENRIVNVINFREIKSYLPIDAVIMAGGRGERLRPITDKTPKPLIKVGDKPILEHNLDRLRLYGVNNYWITVRYKGEQIEEYFKKGHDKNIEIQYIYEIESLGTIGAVSKIKNFSHDYVLVTNSDLLTNIDYEHFFLDFLNQNADFSVVTIPYMVDIPYAVLSTNNGQVVDFQEKPTYTYYSNGGIYLLKIEVLDLIPSDKYFNATDLMEILIKKNYKVISYPLSGYWLDIGRPEDLATAQKDILKVKFT